MKRILFVEDDIGLGETLNERLQKEKYEVDWCRSIGEASKRLKEKKFHLVILDLGLPDGSGFDLAKLIREKSAMPIVFMTAMNTAENRLEGYELGAEEFIPKPFHLKELLMRVKHVFDNHSGPDELKVNKKTIHFASQTVEHEDHPAVRGMIHKVIHLVPVEEIVSETV